jgi:hypothetical protein
MTAEYFLGRCLVIVALVLTMPGVTARTENRIMPATNLQEAIKYMDSFAERTGLTSQRAPQRYLWTDAFAVCNFLGLARVTGNARYTELAQRLVEQVHHTLGRHRSDDARTGWISGLSEQEGEIHPTRGGMRIGKKLPERGPDEPFDDRLEWERDGQYFHYLTKWMHALDQVTRLTGQPRYNTWARELAETAYAAFTYQSFAGGPRRMHWKMSIDLTRALVPSMGQHDPLDGYITYLQLRATGATLADTVSEPNLTNEIKQFAAVVKDGEWATADPLGIGGLLSDAYRVYQLMRQGSVTDDHLLKTLLAASRAGLQYYTQSGDLRMPAEYRLAFRELGLAIGLHAVERMWQAVGSQTDDTSISADVRTQLQALTKYLPIAEEIESFWRNPEHQSASTWSEHRDINEVMLATSLVPDGFLDLLSPK